VKMDRLSSADSVPLDFAVLCPTYNLDRETSQVDAGNPVKFVQNHRERRPQKPSKQRGRRVYRCPVGR
jgi:hypothetical protein